MESSSNRLTAGIIAFVSLIVAFFMGVAINNPPDRIRPYQGLAWIPLLSPNKLAQDQLYIATVSALLR